MKTSVAWVSINRGPRGFNVQVSRLHDEGDGRFYSVASYKHMSPDSLYRLAKICRNSTHVEIIPLSFTLDVTAYAPFTKPLPDLGAVCGTNPNGSMLFKNLSENSGSYPDDLS